MPQPRILLLGSGELGREVAIEAIRLGCHVTAADRYAGAPAMQVAQDVRVLDMTDPLALRQLVRDVRPDHIVPEVEAIATDALQDLDIVVPTARATQLTMDRQGIRRLAAEELGLPTSPYRFAADEDEFLAAVEALGRPVVVKPLMSSSGKGQSVVGPDGDELEAWRYSQLGGRVAGTGVIVEGFVPFAYELTLLTVRHAQGTLVCPPVGHVQEDGDYRESWQPAAVPPDVLARAEDIALRITDALGGRGLFGVEVFVLTDGQVLFSEVSPRPHDTGLVTIGSQRLSEFALHVRAFLGLPIAADDVSVATPAASAVVLGPEDVRGAYDVGGLAAALTIPTSQVRVFGKPESWPGRRLGVTVATGATVEEARERARDAASRLVIS